MATTHPAECSAGTGTLYVAFELSAKAWKLACTPGGAVRPRLRTIRATEWARLPVELAAARRHFHLGATTPVVSCYEAGREGFWIHRYLTSLGVRNVVVDAASIELTRRARQAKTDRLDAERLVAQLVEAETGQAGRPRWRVVRVPPEAAEDAREVIRERRTVRQDRTRMRNRIRGKLATHGVRVTLGRDFPARLAAVRRWDGSPVGAGCQATLVREWEAWQAVEARLRTIEAHPAVDVPPAVAGLQRLAGVGAAGAWTLGVEVLSWRTFANRRDAGAFLGLTPTPHASGTVQREQGISKVGPPALRALMVQLAWQWRRHQPRSALTQWYESRFAHGGPRARRIGIVALARKLWIAFWRFVTQGVVPEGAVLKPA